MKNLPGISAIFLILIAVSNSTCTKNSTSPALPPTLQVQIQQSTSFGPYLVDKNLNTLYFFANDISGQSACTGNCLTVWPVLADSNIAAANFGVGLNFSDFSTIKTSTGVTQLTYKGWPLYNYTPGGVQEPSGQINGDGLGDLFFVAKPNYTIMLANGQLVGNDGNDYVAPGYTAGTVGNTNYLVDAWGATLYTFVIDSANENKFTKSDFSNNGTFPIYDTSSIVVPSILNKALFTTTNVFGKTQLTYNGYPLYYFGADSAKRGNTKGVSIGTKKMARRNANDTGSAASVMTRPASATALTPLGPSTPRRRYYPCVRP